MSEAPYTKRFYDHQRTGSQKSAATIVPWIVDTFRPGRVVDVGCGVGTWAAEFIQCGVPVVRGIDGTYVDRADLAIPQESFLPRDLNDMALTDFDEKFDLSICLEVAEHLSPARAQGFVKFVASLAPIAVFGAAVPRQGGTNHVNEQWQSYWAALFEAEGFVAHDLLRPRFWTADVEPWYAQNTLVYVSKDLDVALPPPVRNLDFIHPGLYGARVGDLAKVRKQLADLKAK